MYWGEGNKGCEAIQFDRLVAPPKLFSWLRCLSLIVGLFVSRVQHFAAAMLLVAWNVVSARRLCQKIREKRVAGVCTDDVYDSCGGDVGRLLSFRALEMARRSGVGARDRLHLFRVVAFGVLLSLFSFRDGLVVCGDCSRYGRTTMA